jgi:hypothetical protein
MRCVATGHTYHPFSILVSSQHDRVGEMPGRSAVNSAMRVATGEPLAHLLEPMSVLALALGIRIGCPGSWLAKDIVDPSRGNESSRRHARLERSITVPVNAKRDAKPHDSHRIGRLSLSQHHPALMEISQWFDDMEFSRATTDHVRLTSSAHSRRRLQSRLWQRRSEQRPQIRAPDRAHRVIR